MKYFSQPANVVPSRSQSVIHWRLTVPVCWMKILKNFKMPSSQTCFYKSIAHHLVSYNQAAYTRCQSSRCSWSTWHRTLWYGWWGVGWGWNDDYGDWDFFFKCSLSWISTIDYNMSIMTINVFSITLDQCNWQLAQLCLGLCTDLRELCSPAKSTLWSRIWW